jgi:hypothetical protein
MLVWPLKGTYCLFDGRLGHGVLDSCSSSTRATLLVNWWTQCPLVRACVWRKGRGGTCADTRNCVKGGPLVTNRRVGLLLKLLKGS